MIAMFSGFTGEKKQNWNKGNGIFDLEVESPPDYHTPRSNILDSAVTSRRAAKNLVTWYWHLKWTCDCCVLRNLLPEPRRGPVDHSPLDIEDQKLAV